MQFQLNSKSKFNFYVGLTLIKESVDVLKKGVIKFLRGYNQGFEKGNFPPKYLM